ncbi:MAG: hypothetical protein BWK80_13145 [Desulfobacteraceae bacterium IS3]|nr:MAG: hypothetical protein BWK80_13145 [Desulfobacteraceae bacterium IS3]
MELWNFLKILKKESPERVRWILVMSVITGVSGGLIVYLVIETAEHILSGRYTLADMVMLPLISLVLVVGKRISQQQTAVVTEDALERIIVRIGNSIRHAELPEIEKQNRADILMSIVRAQTVTDAAVKSVDAFQNLLTIFVCLLYIFLLSSTAGLVCAGIIPFVIISLRASRNMAAPLIRKEAERETELFTLFNHILDGFKELKISRPKNDDLFGNYLKPILPKLRDARIRMIILDSKDRLLVLACTFILAGIDVFILSRLYHYEIVIRILTVLLYSSTPMMIVFTAIPDIANGKAAMEKLYQLSQAKDADWEMSEELCVPSEESIKDFTELDLKDICFEYAGNDDAPGFSVGPVSLNIKAGEIIFVCGGNGSGKSTFIKILCGLYPPCSGTFEIDGCPVFMADHRYLFSTVFGDFHLFDTLYGIGEVDEQKLDSLLVQMEIASAVWWSEGRFSSVSLSAGQKKRLALVAALMEDKPVCIFDEWAAEQDPHFRQYFYESLLPSFKAQGKTVIAVTHDDRYFHTADRIVTMEQGRISDLFRNL